MHAKYFSTYSAEASDIYAASSNSTGAIQSRVVSKTDGNNKTELRKDLRYSIGEGRKKGERALEK